MISGTHWVETPILLDSNLIVSDSGSLTLSGNLSDGGLAKSLTLDGGGELILSGTGSYSGGTVVNTGTLIVASNNGLADDLAGDDLADLPVSSGQEVYAVNCERARGERASSKPASWKIDPRSRPPFLWRPAASRRYRGRGSCCRRHHWEGSGS